MTKVKVVSEDSADAFEEILNRELQELKKKVSKISYHTAAAANQEDYNLTFTAFIEYSG